MKEALIKRIEDYLSNGGLFNPEMANHIAVRDLLIECRIALAQQEQEPVAWEQFHEHMAGPFYTTPPQRTWVGLTLTDREQLRDQFEDWNYPSILVDVISDKLKEKNNHG